MTYSVCIAFKVLPNLTHSAHDIITYIELCVVSCDIRRIYGTINIRTNVDRLIFQRTPKQTVCLCFFFSSLLLFFCVFFRANSLSMTSSIAFRRTEPLLAFKAHNLISMTTDDVNDLKFAVDIYKQMSNSTITSAMRVNYIKLSPPFRLIFTIDAFYD